MAKKSKLVARIKKLEAEIARLIAGRKAKKKAKTKKPAAKKAAAKKTSKPVKQTAPKAKKKPSRKRVIPPPMDRIMAAGEPEFVSPLDVV